MKNKTIHPLLWVTLFSIAMGFFESAVVIYLRTIYYPEGFVFPLKLMSHEIIITEAFRELATMIMLLGIGLLAAKKASERFAYFIYSFAIWDIFYYVFLYFILGWPSSLFTWDVLFIIPLTWVGPVIAPVINSFMMILLALFILKYSSKNICTKIILREWALLISGSLLVLYAYTEEYTNYMLGRFNLSEIIDYTSNPNVLKYATSFIPVYFKWAFFMVGATLHLIGIIHYYYRMKKNAGLIKENNNAF